MLFAKTKRLNLQRSVLSTHLGKYLLGVCQSPVKRYIVCINNHMYLGSYFLKRSPRYDFMKFNKEVLEFFAVICTLLLFFTLGRPPLKCLA